ncbi:N,N-dimethylformamidase beta subunit family domain-containing protein [Maribacter sp. CXY002]|uniref:N,N-dimethylformamidase beta subunit family domain-containing protein n=1 Tax=Maribacter luteocoastalis TaxID=3407671 RepID=UPI003B67BDE0
MAQNHIQLENNKEGTKNWELTQPALVREIEGYASKTSINQGEEIQFYVNTAANLFELEIYRMGWYKGKGARLVKGPVQRKGTQQGIPLPDKETGIVECNWEPSYTLQTDSNWTTGVYLVKLKELLSQKESYIIFVVREDNLQTAILFQLPVTTYQAYNFWGGKSLYDWGSGSIKDWGKIGGKHADKVSFNRPYAGSHNPKAAHGVGAGDFLTNVAPVTTNGYPISSAGWDYNMIRWLEKNGYNVGYITNVDTHRNPTLLSKTSIFLSHGHDEYWSKSMRKNVEQLRDNGINIAFFASNAVYWQIRFEPSIIDKQLDRTIVCYKEPERDPVQGVDTSTNFREAPVNHPEASLLGVQYVNDPVTGDITVSNEKHWVFKNTGLKNGDKLKGLLGYESDALHPSSPKNIEVLATSNSINLYKNNYRYIAQQNLALIQRKAITVISSKLKLSEGTSTTLFKVLAVVFILALAILEFFILKKLPVLGKALLALTFIIPILFFLWRAKSFNAKYAKDFDSHMTIYNHEKKSKVFATGSMQWAWGLDDYNVPKLRKSVKDEKASIITENILEEFGAKQSN